ncbi:unnamed protein product [Dovyalis caffra]|uniref:AP2/ERF domain-containing protein n=1 Tax=Dovyalis caffra TaxID=77055 RepID=A0AAV1QRS2_9ROSI|nr:unnamed protein product [Dovyalis caffra]
MALFHASLRFRAWNPLCDPSTDQWAPPASDKWVIGIRSSNPAIERGLVCWSGRKGNPRKASQIRHRGNTAYGVAKERSKIGIYFPCGTETRREALLYADSSQPTTKEMRNKREACSSPSYAASPADALLSYDLSEVECLID